MSLICPSCFHANVVVLSRESPDGPTVMATLSCEECGNVWRDRLRADPENKPKK